jgi:hypothetical protein
MTGQFDGMTVRTGPGRGGERRNSGVGDLKKTTTGTHPSDEHSAQRAVFHCFRVPQGIDEAGREDIRLSFQFVQHRFATSPSGVVWRHQAPDERAEGAHITSTNRFDHRGWLKLRVFEIMDARSRP